MGKGYISLLVMYLRQLSWPLIIQKFVQIDTPF